MLEKALHMIWLTIQFRVETKLEMASRKFIFVQRPIASFETIIAWYIVNVNLSKQFKAIVDFLNARNVFNTQNDKF